jgi:hypothetical protein
VENVALFYDQFEHFTAVWHILWPFGIVCVPLVYFPVLVPMFGRKKSGNPEGKQSFGDNFVTAKAQNPNKPNAFLKHENIFNSENIPGPSTYKCIKTEIFGMQIYVSSGNPGA